MTCGKGTETSDLVCPPVSYPREIGPNGAGAGKVDFSGGISQKPVRLISIWPTIQTRSRIPALRSRNLYAFGIWHVLAPMKSPPGLVRVGMGEGYKAQDTNMNREARLKVASGRFACNPELSSCQRRCPLKAFPSKECNSKLNSTRIWSARGEEDLMLKHGLSFAILFVCALAGAVQAQTHGKIDFERDVLPILQQNWVGCHGPAQQTNGFPVDRKSSVFKAGTRRICSSNWSADVTNAVPCW
jgi:hypothetical protein